MLQHGAQVRRCFSELWRNLPLFRAQDACQRLRAARTGVQREGLHLLYGLLRNNQQAAHLFLRRNGHVRQDHQIGDALVFDGRNDRDVHFSGSQLFGTLRGHGKRQIVLAAQRAVGEAPHERRGVQVLNDGDAKFRHGLRGHL